MIFVLYIILYYMKFLLTCPRWTASILTWELKHLWYKCYDTFETGTYLDGELNDMYRLNLWSRVANKVYIKIGTCNAGTYDQLYEGIAAMPRSSRLYAQPALSISPVLNHAILFSIKSLQSISHKAILDRCVWEESSVSDIIDIKLMIDRDNASCWLNTSGAGLHQRGYRIETWEAPIKENLAAAIVLYSTRRRKQRLIDPFCGSGTILIEAAMIARNIAPGLKRTFAFETMKPYDEILWEHILREAEGKIYHKVFDMVWLDIDHRMTSKAANNASRAGVGDTIQRVPKPIQDFRLIADQPSRMVTNPPYGKRLELDDNARNALQLLMNRSDVSWVILSGSEEIFNAPRWSKQFKNWSDTILGRRKVMS